MAERHYDGRRIELVGLAERNEVVVEARIPYVTDGDGMHTFTDPADGETYVSAYLGMDIAQRVFPCFDQNDLKAPIGLTVRAPGLDRPRQRPHRRGRRGARGASRPPRRSRRPCSWSAPARGTR